jgi:hypothetical protein
MLILMGAVVSDVAKGLVAKLALPVVDWTMSVRETLGVLARPEGVPVKDMPMMMIVCLIAPLYTTTCYERT